MDVNFKEFRLSIESALKKRFQYEDRKHLRLNLERALKKRTEGSYWTRTETFQKLCQWAFKTCDTTKTGTLTKDELYSGLLLVYINVAKYAGPAACYPPKKEVVDLLFDACDFDNSGDISEDEFVTIMVILSSQLTWRIATYYMLIILLVPYVVKWAVAVLCFVGADDTFLRIDRMLEAFLPYPFSKMVAMIPDSIWENLPKGLVSFGIFTFVIPYCWDSMDEHFQDVALKRSSTVQVVTQKQIDQQAGTQCAINDESEQKVSEKLE